MLCTYICMLLLITGYTIEVKGNDDHPCNQYQSMDMYGGQRHVNFTPPDPKSHIPICDRVYYVTGSWYRFVHDNVNYELATSCQPLYSCGTEAPIWMEGMYPSTAGLIVHNHLCTNFQYISGDSGICTCHSEWVNGSITVDVQLCEDGHGGSFYIHRFDEIPTCNLGFCVKNHPDGVNVHTGDVIKCDEKDGACTTVTVVLESTISNFLYAVVYCNYVPREANSQNHVIQSTWKSHTTVQCPLPTTTVNGETRRIFGLYNLHVVQTSNGNDQTQNRGSLDVLIYDSTCHICDFTNYKCQLKDQMCLVNGKCCAGNQCNLCATGTTPDVDLGLTTTSDSTTTTTSNNPTPSSTPTSTNRLTGSSSTTLSENTDATSTTTTVVPRKSTDEDREGRGFPGVWVAVSVLAVVTAVILFAIVVYIYRSKRKPREVDQEPLPPPYSEVSFLPTNSTYGGGVYITPTSPPRPVNGATGGNQVLKVPLDDPRHLAYVNQNENNDLKMREARSTVAEEAWENERPSHYYHEIPYDRVEAISPTDDKNNHGEYASLSPTDERFSNPYAVMTPGLELQRTYSEPNTYVSPRQPLPSQRKH